MPLPRNKNCQKGYACGNSCISRTKNCRKQLSKQSRSNAEWIKNNHLLSPQDYIIKGRRLLSDEDAAFIDNYAATIDRIKSRLNEKNRKDTEYQKLKDEESAIQQRIEKIWLRIFNTSPLSVKEAEELVEKQVTFKDGENSTVRRDLIDFARVTGGLGLDSKLSVEEAEGRATSNTSRIIVNDYNRRAVFHEAAHHIEYQNPSIGLIARTWTRQRAFSQEVKKLRDITGDERYGDDEVALEGNFISPYVGRVYKISRYTEVISMGIERLSSPDTMAELARDPDHFFFTLGVLRR